MFANTEDITLLCGDAKLLYKSRKNGRTQCSPQSLAQQVRDHSLLVRLKICTRGVLSIGAGGRGGEWSERHGLTLGGTKFLEIPCSHFKTSFAHTGHC